MISPGTLQLPLLSKRHSCSINLLTSRQNYQTARCCVNLGCRPLVPGFPIDLLQEICSASLDPVNLLRAKYLGLLTFLFDGRFSPPLRGRGKYGRVPAAQLLLDRPGKNGCSEVNHMELMKDRSRPTGQPNNTAALPEDRAFGSNQSRWLKLALGGTVFVLITVSIFFYQFSRIEHGDEAFTWSGLRFEYLWLMLLCLPFDTLSSGLRIWLVCRVLQPRTGFWTCLKAEWANSGIAMLTPSQTGGGFGQIYMLHRGGVGITAATTISLISFLGTMLSLLVVGLYSVLIAGARLGFLFSEAIWSLTIILALMSAALVRPSLFCAAISHTLKAYRWISGFVPYSHQHRVELVADKLTGLVYDYHHGTWRFVRTGRAHFAGVCLLSSVSILARCLTAFLCLRFLGIGNSTLGEVLQIQMALVFLLYFAPTPGSSGLAEVFSLSAMAAILPAGLAPYYNLFWRASTLYLPAGLGLLLLVLTILKDTRTLLRRHNRTGESPSQPGLCIPAEGQSRSQPSLATAAEKSTLRGSEELPERRMMKWDAVAPPKDVAVS
jgi:uncharacterized protein (TIRG00374 family)